MLHYHIIYIYMYLSLTQRGSFEFIRFLFPFPFPRFKESTEGRKFAFPFEGWCPRPRAQTVRPQCRPILLFRCNKQTTSDKLKHFSNFQKIKYFLSIENIYSVVLTFHRRPWRILPWKGCYARQLKWKRSLVKERGCNFINRRTLLAFVSTLDTTRRSSCLPGFPGKCETKISTLPTRGDVSPPGKRLPPSCRRIDRFNETTTAQITLSFVGIASFSLNGSSSFYK